MTGLLFCCGIDVFFSTEALQVDRYDNHQNIIDEPHEAREGLGENIDRRNDIEDEKQDHQERMFIQKDGNAFLEFHHHYGLAVFNSFTSSLIGVGPVFFAQ